jgi:hypothetical protein
MISKGTMAPKVATSTLKGTTKECSIMALWMEEISHKNIQYLEAH